MRFREHGPAGLIFVVAERVGDDCELVDARKRPLRSVPVEMLEPAEVGA